MSYLTQAFNTPAPQREPEMGREQDQVKNNAGGYVFPVTPEIQLDRFLILGSEGGSYYASERALTLENAKNALNMVKGEKGIQVVKRVVELAHGRAPKIGPPLFVLAMAASYGNTDTRTVAFEVLPQVARTASHLFQFIEYVDSMRGWGRALKNGINNWYTSKTPENLAYQVVKYRTRNSWSHRDVLRKTHPMSYDHNNLFAYLTNKAWTEEDSLSIVKAYEAAKTMDSKELVEHITKHSLTWEMLPTESLRDMEVWRAMLPDMPATALLRNLGRLTRLELLKPLSDEASQVAAKFSSAEWVKYGRLHPFNILLAYYTYIRGQGYQSRNSGRGRSAFSDPYGTHKPDWEPVQSVVDALETAFNHSFQNVAPTGQKIYVGLDVSGSMRAEIMGTPISAREGAAALALYVAKTEPNFHVAAFSAGTQFSTRRFVSRGTAMVPMDFSSKDSLQDILRKTERLPFGGTDCALPMMDALEKKIEVDCFLVLTDSETWAGPIHPFRALEKYRAEMNRPAKLVVVGMTSNEFSIADPSDAGMLDIVGFDAAMPRLISDFITN